MTRLLCMRLGTGQPGATLVTCILRDGSPRTQADMWSRQAVRNSGGQYRMPDDSLRLAVLIDADNASAAVIGDILSVVASLGPASVKRVYGDFTTSTLNSWRAVLAEHAVQPIQQFRNTVGKNASDSALIIDAMDLLHTRELGGFCLVSSDSDFTRLA